MSINTNKRAHIKPIKKDLSGLEKDVCPYCGSTKVVMFDADNDICNKCGKYFPGK